MTRWEISSNTEITHASKYTASRGIDQFFVLFSTRAQN